MSTAALLIVGLVIAVGLVGIVVPVLPGGLLVLAAIGYWAYDVSTATSWTVLAVAAGVLLVTQVAKYVVPGRRLTAGEIPRATLVVGAVVAIVGFFVVPVIGLPIGFVLGVYAAEYQRLGTNALAWPSTTIALRAVGLSMAIEMAGGLVAAGLWLGTVLATR